VADALHELAQQPPDCEQQENLREKYRECAAVFHVLLSMRPCRFGYATARNWDQDGPQGATSEPARRLRARHSAC
jgi:hypothetical protein